MLLAHLKRLLTTNWHFAGVIVYFILHGYVIRGDLLPLPDLFLYLGILLMGGLLLFGICYRLFGKDQRKAGLFTSCILVICLFFGVLQDYLMLTHQVAWLAKFRVLLPCLAGLVIVVFVALKITKRTLNKPLLFVNVLLAVYILFDAGILVFRSLTSDYPAPRPQLSFTACDTCKRPSVYLVLLDEYAGDTVLKHYFRYDNAAFKSFLGKEGFHIVKHPASNYQVTMFSISSMLNMCYLQPEGRISMYNHLAYNYALRGIRDNEVADRFEKMGYRISNLSPFSMRQEVAGYNPGLVPEKKDLLNSPTIWYRIAQYLPTFWKNIGAGDTWAIRKDDKLVAGNRSMMEGALALSLKPGNKPVFSYIHLTMPHQPYAFDSTGKRISPPAGKPMQAMTDQHYLQYLVYTNKVISAFISELKKNTKNDAVILLMSDHGYRDAAIGDHARGHFDNLNAVYLPGRQYQGWYDGMTNVNQFRVLFNTLFQQRLPMLKDSVVY
jgi:hypothetical protein